MTTALITGSAGLIGSETAKFFHEKGMDIIGVDNNMRKYFFGADGSVEKNAQKLSKTLNRYQHQNVDIRDYASLEKIFSEHKNNITCICYT